MKVIQMPSNHLPLPSGTIYILVFDLFLLKTNKEILTSEKLSETCLLYKTDELQNFAKSIQENLRRWINI